jgi:anion-transporting  ArsA/GET3 family ATPase
MDDVERLLTRRLLFVTGKGGVGKSTIAAALGLLAARRGMRAIVCELSARGDVPRVLGVDAEGVGEQELTPSLWWTAIDPERAMEEYLTDQLPVRALAELLARSRTFGYLAAATPGLRELLALGKAWDMAQHERRAGVGPSYDMVVVDAPATGHALGFLASPRTFANVAQVGPVARQAERIRSTLCDSSVTGVVAVTTPQEAAVTEALTLRERLAVDLDIPLAAVIVNALHPWRFTPRDLAAVRAAAPNVGGDARRALDVALAEDHRVHAERAHLRRLREQLGVRPPELPFVYSPELGRAHVDLFADLLERAR